MNFPLRYVGALAVIAVALPISASPSTALTAHRTTASSQSAASRSGHSAPKHALGAPAGAGSTTATRQAAAAVHKTASHNAAPASLPQPVTDVTAYGAVGDGTTDSGAAVRAALNAASQVGGTLYFPTGHYRLSALDSGGALSIHAALTIAGDGAASSVITGVSSGAPVLGIRHDNVTVQDLTIDAQSHDLGTSVYMIANNVTLQRDTILGGSHSFAIYAAGDASGAQGNTGNQLLDDTVNDWTQFPLGDGISWSYQHNSLISNLNHTGSRLALYRDTNVTVNGDTFHPSTRTVQANVIQGFWISAPSDHITINNFTSYGNGGRTSGNGGAANTNVTITNDRMLGSGGQLRVDGAPGMVIDGCDFGTTNTLAFAATVPMTGVVVQNCSSLPSVTFWDTASVSATFNSDTFTTSTNVLGIPRSTFSRYGRATPPPADVAVTGGSWTNQSGTFSRGGPMTFVVKDLRGYN